ncbi:MAG: carbohydrate kinase family protein [Patescibacteria group bacterium]|nr:carbohydrate kinase family protein [Patescibacteria group bacterium]
MFDFITIGGATRDIFFKYDNLQKRKDKKSISGSFLMVPYGEKMVSKKVFYAYGGGAFNASTCIARLGGRVAAVCNIGSEGTGSLVFRALKDEGVNVSLISRDKNNHTGLSIFILGKDNEHSGFLERGANDFLKIEKISYLKKTRWIYLSSLTGESSDLIEKVFNFSAKKNIKIAFNPGSEQLNRGAKYLSGYIKKTEILILNMDEAKALVFSGGVKKIKNRRELLFELEKLGAKITVVTDGQDGCHLIIDKKIYSQAAIPSPVFDTTGAGDSFGATFAYAISRDFGVKKSLKMAAINSSSVVSYMGAQDGLLKLNQIRRSKWLSEKI